MESGDDEDVSARVLLRNVLQTESQRSPVTRSMSHDQRLSRVRRSSRLRNTPESPHVALRHKLKQKLHETATQSPLPPSKRARSMGRKLNTPAMLTSPALFDDDVTPRGLLRGIIQTETEASLLLSGQTGVPQGDLQDIETSIQSNRRSDGVSGLELPDLATEPLTHMIRGMSRRRPPPTFNVSAFEKQLSQSSGTGTSGEEEEMDVCQENSDLSKEQDLSAGSKSVLSLTLKTPFVNLRSERGGLKRKAAGRRPVSVDAFDEAVQKRLETHHSPVVQDGRTLQDSEWHKFTLGLSNISVPELTTDVMLSNTELYAQPQASESKLRDTDEGVTVAEMERGDGDEELQEDIQNQQNVSESNVSKRKSDPTEHLESNSQSQEEEEEEVEMIPPSQENSLCPEDIPFIPTQPMVEPPPRQQEEHESEVQKAQVEEMDQRKDESLREEEISHVAQQITRRAYYSEGGAMRNGVMARGRGTKSLGRGEDPTGKELQSFTGATELEEIDRTDEKPHQSPASSSAIHTTRPSSSLTRRDLGQSESEQVMVSVHVSPTVDFTDDEQDVQELQEEVIEQDEEEQKDHLQEQQHEEVEEQLQEQHEEVEEQLQEQHEEVEEQLQEQHEEVEEQLQEQSEEPEEELDEEDDAQSEELSMQTPGFIRQRKQVSTPGALTTPTVLKALNSGPAPKVAKPRQKRTPKSSSAGVLPKSYVMSVFKHFAKTKVASDVYPVISDILQRYFDRLADDLEVYSAHAKRKTIEVEDVELLMRRQGFVTDKTPVNVLIEKFLPLEYRKLLIPVATSGNKVVPDQRR